MDAQQPLQAQECWGSSSHLALGKGKPGTHGVNRAEIQTEKEKGWSLPSAFSDHWHDTHID